MGTNKNLNIHGGRHACLQCKRTSVGREIERNFYPNQPSYCKFCDHTVVATQHWLKARGSWAGDVPRRIRKRYAPLLRFCQVKGITPSDLGWWIAADMAKNPFTGI